MISKRSKKNIEDIPVVIIGAGLSGLTLALDLANKNVPFILLDQKATIGEGSRAVCFARRTLEIFDRLGVVDCIINKGIPWHTAKIHLRNHVVAAHEFANDTRYKHPPYVNLQQYYLETYLKERLPRNIDFRPQHKLIGIQINPDTIILTIETDKRTYQISADYIVAADGVKSTTRQLLSLPFNGEVFEDKFLIADIEMEGNLPSERWFWFDAEFNDGRCALLLKQPDNIWRLDFHLPKDADTKIENQPSNVIRRVKSMLGENISFQLKWSSIYQFKCRRLDKLRHDRVFFIGDAAHQMSPFGARGANSGIQDADNLGWKLSHVINGNASDKLLDSYHVERSFAATENIKHSTRSTHFISPPSKIKRLFRDCVLELAQSAPFARAMINSGRLSTPTHYYHSSLVTTDKDTFDCELKPGSPCLDAPVLYHGQSQWLLSFIKENFIGLYFNDDLPFPKWMVSANIFPIYFISHQSSIHSETFFDKTLIDHLGVVQKYYDGKPGTFYLIRPDQYIVARWRIANESKIKSAFNHALGLST